MIMIVVSYLALCLVVCLFRRLMPVVLGIGFCLSWYVLFIRKDILVGLSLAVLLCFVYVLYRVAMGDTPGRRYDKKDVARSHNSQSSSSTKWIWYLVPIFWPFMIAKVVLCDKTLKTDMKPFDYEQHLKSNAR